MPNPILGDPSALAEAEAASVATAEKAATTFAKSHKIRNILQSHQEREIVKTAPDMVVYIEALPFLINPYLSQENKDKVIVNFNDFITTISTSNSIDSFIPTGSVQLSVPNGFKHLFLAPGGNTIIDLMSAIRIYAKSYFYSKTGNTVYRRIFNGLIKSVVLTELPTGLEIAIEIVGICRLLEIVQIELNKGFISNSSTAITTWRTNQGSLTVYGAIYDTFERELDLSEFIKANIFSNTPNDNENETLVKNQYIAKWATRLQDLRRDVRIFGVSNSKDVVKPITGELVISQDRAKKGAPRPPAYKESDSFFRDNKAIIQKLRAYHFDMAIGSLRLTGNQLTPRIERIRTLVDLAGMEGYQDVDGLIIIKPPLYNLDCTVLGTATKELKDENLYEDANPYIIHMAEVLSENYSEDEAGIRRTTMTLAANFATAGGFQVEGHIEISPVVRYVDINLVRRFGIREEPPKYFGMLTSDQKANYAFSVCELNKANRNFRTYHVSIPLRPEVRLGFPVFVPHKDIYAYITGVAMSYTVGGQATTSLTCNYVRKRPLIRQRTTVSTPSPDGKGPATVSKVLVYASQPNLVHAWTTGPPPPAPAGADNELVLLGAPSTLPPLPSEEPTTNEKAIRNYETKKMAQLYETWIDNGPQKGAWRIQNDDGRLKPMGGVKLDEYENKYWYNGKMDEDTGVRKRPHSADLNYLDRGLLVQPYTDEKGYEVIPLLPWGRYSTLREALTDCTRNYWYDNGSAAFKETIGKEIKKTSAFLMAGFALPSGKSSADLQAELDKNKSALTSAQSNAAVASVFNTGASSFFQAQAAAASGAVNATTAEQATKGTSQNSMSEAMHQFELFDKSNLVSFELSYNDNSFGKPSDPSSVMTVPGQMQIGPNSADTAVPQTPEPNFVNKLQTFLEGFMGPQNSSNVGPYAVSLQPQNTDIGGYRPQAGPLSGVLLSMQATFNSSPYGQFLGLGPKPKTGSSYFTSDYSIHRNIG